MRSRAPGSSSPAPAPTTLSESSASTAALFSATDTDTMRSGGGGGRADGHPVRLTARPQLLGWRAAPLPLTAERRLASAVCLSTSDGW